MRPRDLRPVVGKWRAVGESRTVGEPRTSVGKSRTRTPGAIAVALAVLTGCTPISTDQAAAPEVETAEVVAVVDGDTIDIATDAGTARVRLIGIDTPEIGRERDPGECYAEEARNFLDGLVYGHTVELRSDPSQANADRYGRLLRHVYINGESAAILTLEAGAGYEYTYDEAYTGQREHRDAERSAEAAGSGVWSACGE